jgi:hypothetical protein
MWRARPTVADGPRRWPRWSRSAGTKPFRSPGTSAWSRCEGGNPRVQAVHRSPSKRGALSRLQAAQITTRLFAPPQDVSRLFQEADLQYTSKVTQLEGQIRDLHAQLSSSHEALMLLRQEQDALQERDHK